MKTILLIGILLATVCGVSLSGASTNASVFPAHAAWQTSLQNGETLKACLRERLLGENDVVYQGWTPWDLAIWFKEEADGLSDERLHEALTAIYRESEAQSDKNARDLMIHVALWLGVCADDATKTFLLKLAADTSKDGFLRTTALSSFLRNADAQEVRDALIRFLVGEGRDVNRLSVYSNARELYDNTPPEDEPKRRAIIVALMVAAAHEEEKIGFMKVDRILTMRSDAYRHSRERLDLLKRHSLEPPTQNLYTDSDLNAALSEARKFKIYTSVNTNLSMLEAHAFSKNHLADDADRWGGKLLIPDPEAEFSPQAYPPKVADASRRSIWPWLIGVAGLVVASVGLWLLRKRRKMVCK